MRNSFTAHQGKSATLASKTFSKHLGKQKHKDRSPAADMQTNAMGLLWHSLSMADNTQAGSKQGQSNCHQKGMPDMRLSKACADVGLLWQSLCMPLKKVLETGDVKVNATCLI